MINKTYLKTNLAPFNDIKIKKIYKDKSKKFCYGQVTTWVWERKRHSTILVRNVT